VEVYIYAFLTLALDGIEWWASRPGRFTPRERAPVTRWIGGWVGPRAVLDAVKRKNPRPCRQSNPRPSGPFASAVLLSYPETIQNYNRTCFYGCETWFLTI